MGVGWVKMLLVLAMRDGVFRLTGGSNLLVWLFFIAYLYSN